MQAFAKRLLCLSLPRPDSRPTDGVGILIDIQYSAQQLTASASSKPCITAQPYSADLGCVGQRRTEATRCCVGRMSGRIKSAPLRLTELTDRDLTNLHSSTSSDTAGLGLPRGDPWGVIYTDLDLCMVIRVCCSARTASRPANGVRLASPFVGVVLAHPPPRSITAPNSALLWQRAPRGLADNGLRPPAVWARTHSSSSFAPARGEGIVQEAAPGNMCSRTPPRHAHAPFLSSSCPGSLGAETFLQSTRRPSPRASWLGWSVCGRAFNGRRRICVL